MNYGISQDILVDKSSTGKARPWKDKKAANCLLAAAYESLGTNTPEYKTKASKLRECASWLEFAIGENGVKKLHKANFCRLRLCPICAWRRSLKIYSHTSRIMAGMKSERVYAYLFLTLTVRNCSSDQLSTEISNMMSSWNRFMGYKAIKDVVRGWYRGLEITHNIDQSSPFFGTFHPHFHCILAVPVSYFKNAGYLSHEKWTSLWKKAARLDYEPQVDVRRIKGDTAKAVAEVAKYAVKDADYIIPDDWDLTTETVKLLDEVLAYRRLVAYGGKMAEWHKKLNLDDEMDGDLIHVDGDEIPEEQQKLINYVWNVGYNQYYCSGS